LTGWPAVLASEEVRLRPLRAVDARAWTAVRARNADWLASWDATVPPGAQQRPASFRALARTLRSQARGGTAYPFALEVDRAFAGQVTVNNIVRGSAQFASIGYWIDQRHAGRGAVPRAVALVIDHCFSAGGLHRIEVAIRPENTNSLRVVEKLGIREMGYAPRYLHINGEWRDHRIFAVTVEECPGGMLHRLKSHQPQE
jgi:[ribosomal protein S5]-alanine N-acetyltransferase